jgi:hypothetical protein
LILAIGQNATDQGQSTGLMISLFDVSDFSNPTRIREFAEDTKSHSAAQYDHRAFRYLPQSKLLIVPLYINTLWSSFTDPEFFDSFVVYNVDETQPFSKKFNISHVSGNDAATCMWSSNKLASRSLVFNGQVTTMKGHSVYSHSLDTETMNWGLKLDDVKTDDDCFFWWS